MPELTYVAYGNLKYNNNVVINVVHPPPPLVQHVNRHCIMLVFYGAYRTIVVRFGYGLQCCAQYMGGSLGTVQYGMGSCGISISITIAYHAQ